MTGLLSQRVIAGILLLSRGGLLSVATTRTRTHTGCETGDQVYQIKCELTGGNQIFMTVGVTLLNGNSPAATRGGYSFFICHTQLN